MMPLDRGVKGSGKIAMQKAKLLLRLFSFRFSDEFRPRCKRSGKIANLLLRIFGFRFLMFGEYGAQNCFGFWYFTIFFCVLRFSHFLFNLMNHVNCQRKQ